MATKVEVFIGRAKLEIDSWVNNSQKWIASIDRMRKAWAQAASDIAAAVQKTSLIVGGALAATAALGIKYNSFAQQSQIAFETLLGSADRAKAHMEELRRFAEKTPFNLNGVVDASRKLIAMGINANKVIPTLTAVGDAVAAMGGDNVMLDRVVRAIGQIQARGKVAAEEMMQLAENGIPAWEMLAKALNMTVAETMKAVTDGLVSADVGIQAIIGGMNQKFGGLMAKQSVTFGGMLSNMQDFGQRALMAITEPLFNGLQRLMAKTLAWSSSGEFKQVVANLRAQVAAFTVWAEDAIPKAIKGFRDLLPTIVELAKSFAGWLKYVADFMIAHPQLLAALIALKVTGFLGINTAVLSTGKALVTTAVEMTKMIGVVGMLKVAIVGGLVVAIGALILKLTGALDVYRQFGAETAKAQRLADAFFEQDEKRHQRRMAVANSVNNDPQRKNAFLNSEIAKDQKNLPGLESAVKAAKKAIDDMDDAANVASGGRLFKDLNQQLTEADARLANAKRRIDEMREALAKPAPATPAGAQAVPGAAGAPAAGGPAPGMPDIKAMQAQAGADKADAKSDKKAVDMVIAFGDALDDFVRNGTATKEELQGFAVQAVELAKACQAGKISTQQLDQALETMEFQIKEKHKADVEMEKEKAQLEDDITTSSANFTESMREIVRDGNMTEQTFVGLTDRVVELAQQCFRGEITLDDMNRELSDMAWAAKKAADATKKAKEKEEELAKLRMIANGNFLGAGINPQEELLRRIAQYRMQQFNDGMDALARSMLGLDQQVDKTTSSMDAFEGGFAGGFAGAHGGGGGNNQLDQIFQFLNSKEGQVANLQNQIALLQQNINTGKRFGIPQDRINQWQQMIQDLLVQLNQLTAQMPTFIGYSEASPAPKDPALGNQTVDQPGRHITIVNNSSFPNATRFSMMDEDVLYKRMVAAGRRLGDTAFISGSRF